MAVDIERLLRLTADYHAFRSDDAAEEETAPCSDDLSAEELDFVAAAGTAVQYPKEDGKGSPKRP